MTSVAIHINFMAIKKHHDFKNSPWLVTSQRIYLLVPSSLHTWWGSASINRTLACRPLRHLFNSSFSWTFCKWLFLPGADPELLSDLKMAFLGDFVLDFTDHRTDRSENGSVDIYLIKIPFVAMMDRWHSERRPWAIGEPGGPSTSAWWVKCWISSHKMLLGRIC